MTIRKRTYVSVAYTHAMADARVRRHCESLARRGWRVFQLGLGQEGERGVARLNGVVYVRFLRRRYRGGNLLHYIRAYLAFLLWARRLLARLGQRSPVAVVQANNIPNFVVWAASRARRSGAGVILDIHDPVPELFASKFGTRKGAGLMVRLLRLEERWSARGADTVLCVNEPHREMCTAHGLAPSKLRVVLNAADGCLFPTSSPRAPSPFVVYHGTVTARMGLDGVLGAIALLRGEGTEVRGAVWGDGDAVDDLRRLRDRLGLGEVVDIPGERVVLDQLVPRLAAVGISLIPMRRDVFTDVILPTKLVEVARLGIPAVVTWTPTVARYFPEDTVHYVHEPTPGGFAAAIRDVLARPREARERAVRAQVLPIARSWQEIEGEFVRAVEEVNELGARR